MLSDRFVERVTGELTHVQRNGDPDRGYPGCVNLSFAYVEGESLLMALKDIALSSGFFSHFRVFIRNKRSFCEVRRLQTASGLILLVIH
jgi:hypothetical protein